MLANHPGLLSSGLFDDNAENGLFLFDTVSRTSTLYVATQY